MEKKRGGDIFLVNSTLIKRPYYTRFRVYSMQLLFSSTFSFFFFCSYIHTYVRTLVGEGGVERKEKYEMGQDRYEGSNVPLLSLYLSLSLSLRHMNIANFKDFHGSKEGRENGRGLHER